MRFSHKSRLPLALLATSFMLAGQLPAALVAYYPVDSATDSSNFLDDIIDNAGHGAADGTSSNNSASIVFDATRGGDVLSTVQGHRFSAGTQDINLAVGFTWSVWFRSPSLDFNKNESGADVIIGSRNGIWNKVQTTGTARYFDLGGYDVDDGNWHHIVYTGNATDGGALWVDGVEVATDATPFNGTQTVNDVFEIGGSSRFSEDVDGFIDDLAIWNEVLSDADIGRLYTGTSPLAIPEPGAASLGLIGALLLLRRRRR